jgi:hypothetical protein
MDYENFFKELECAFREKNLKFNYDYQDTLDELKKDSLFIVAPAKNALCCTQRIFFDSYYASSIEEVLSFLSFDLLRKTESIPEEIYARMLLSCWKNPWSDVFWAAWLEVKP